MEHFLIQGLVLVLRPHRQEDVPSNEFVDGFARALNGGKGDFLVLKVENDSLVFPVDVPGLQYVVAPSLDGVSSVEIHADHPVAGHAHQLLHTHTKGWVRTDVWLHQELRYPVSILSMGHNSVGLVMGQDCIKRTGTQSVFCHGVMTQ